jgi:hypothetical protein
LILGSVDVKDLKTYQQLFIYFVPIVSNLGFVNILVVVVRLYWFEKRLKETGNVLHHVKGATVRLRFANAVAMG